jgi:predicted transcriptional regulator
MAVKSRTARFETFKAFTRAVASGKRKAGAREPKIWCEPIAGAATGARIVRFHSFEAGAKLLSRQNRALLRTISRSKPRSVTELAAMTGRAGQNVLRTLNKLAAAGIVKFDKGEGRAHRPVLMARKVHFEVDLAS